MRNNLLIILLSIILLVGVAVFVFLSFNKNHAPHTLITKETQEITPPVAYNDSSMNNIVDKANNKPLLSRSDTEAKATIIKTGLQGKRYGVLYETPNVRIDYTTSADMLQAKILSTDFVAAKREGNTWFLSRGLSQQGICDLPVLYYLNWDIAQSLKDKNIIFNPLSPGCN